MTDEVTAGIEGKPEAAADHTASDFGGQKRNLDGTIEGWTPPADHEPSMEERAARLVADMEHAMAHNSPISIAMMNEARALLGVAKPDETPPAPAAD